MPRVLAISCRSVAAKQASPTRSERSDAARRAWVGRGAGGKPKKNRPIQNPSLPSLVGTAPVRPGRATRQFAPARPSAPARSSSPAHRRTALAPSSAPAPSPSPLAAGWTPPIAAPKAACAAGPSLAGWEGKFGTTRVLAIPCRSVAAKQASPTRNERSDAARRAWVGRGTGGKSRKHRPIQNPSLPSLVGTAPVRPGRATRQFAPARPSAPARSSSPAHRRTALAPPSAPAPSPSPLAAGCPPPIAAPKARPSCQPFFIASPPFPPLRAARRFCHAPAAASMPRRPLPPPKAPPPHGDAESPGFFALGVQRRPPPARGRPPVRFSAAPTLCPVRRTLPFLRFGRAFRR